MNGPAADWTWAGAESFEDVCYPLSAQAWPGRRSGANKQKQLGKLCGEVLREHCARYVCAKAEHQAWLVARLRFNRQCGGMGHAIL